MSFNFIYAAAQQFFKGTPPPKIPECPYDLTKIHHNVLIKWRNKCYALGGKYDPYNDGDGPMVYLEHIKTELAKRPHIPNKQERKIARQALAKSKKNS